MGVFVGLLFGAVMTFGFMMQGLEDDLNKGAKANKLVEECQKTLPRTVECVIVAVPETEIEEE